MALLGPLRISWVSVMPAAEDPVQKLMIHTVQVPTPFGCPSRGNFLP